MRPACEASKEDRLLAGTAAVGLVALATASFGVAVSSFVQVHGEKGWATLSPAFTWRDPRYLSGKAGNQTFAKKFFKDEDPIGKHFGDPTTNVQCMLEC